MRMGVRGSNSGRGRGALALKVRIVCRKRLGIRILLTRVVPNIASNIKALTTVVISHRTIRGMRVGGLISRVHVAR